MMAIADQGPTNGFFLQDQDDIWHFNTGTNRSQAFNISSEAVRYARSGKVLDAAKWAELVKKHCPSAGQWIYKGLDNSDIRTLLALAIQVTEGQAE